MMLSVYLFHAGSIKEFYLNKQRLLLLFIICCLHGFCVWFPV